MAISYTQLDTYATCPRKWGYRYLGERKESTSKSFWQDAGTAVHLAAACILKKQPLPSFPLPIYANAAQEAVNAVQRTYTFTNPHVEEELTGDLFGAEAVGFADLWFVTNGTLVVLDWKTTTKKYAPKNYLYLKDDLQLCLYVHLILQQLKVPPRDIRIGQVIINYQNPANARVLGVCTVMVTPAEVRATLAKRKGTVEAVTTINTLPETVNTKACGEFGGCEFRFGCHRGQH